MYFVRQQKTAGLSLKSRNDSLAFKKPLWKLGDKALGEGHKITVNLKELIDNKVVSITDSEDETKKFQFKLTVYEKPVAKFELTGNKHNGEFLFDDAKYEPLRMAELYTEISASIFHKDYAIEKTKKYHTPIIGLLLGHTEQLKLNVKGWKTNDPNFKIKLKTTNPNIKLENQDSLTVTANNTAINIKVIKDVFDYKTKKKREYINVYDQSDELIGKLEVYCEKVEAKTLKFIYIKDENGNTSNLVDTSILFNMNTSSHNQIFKEWENKSTEVIHLDSLTNAYLIKHDQPITRRAIERYRQEIKNSKSKLYYSYRYLKDIPEQEELPYTPVFLMPNEAFKANGKQLGGSNFVSDDNEGIKHRYTFIYKGGNENTVFHEQGHDLGLEHIFEDYPAIPEKSTKNYMDYAPTTSTDERINFFKYQMIPLLLKSKNE